MSTFDDIAVLTSENVRLTYTLAGMGSRSVAFLADTFIIVLSMIAITFIFLTMGLSFSDLSALVSGEDPEAPLLAAMYIVVMTLLYWGYYFFFEWINWGQTPGKQLLGIRVAMADGAPADLVACAVRNVVRVIDIGLAVVGITFFILIFTPRYQRIGDLTAGTVVVKRRRLEFDDVINAAISADRAAEALVGERGSKGLTIKLSDAEHGLLERYLARRDSLPEDVRDQLVKELGARIRSKNTGIAIEEKSDEELIEAAWSQSPRRM